MRVSPQPVLPTPCRSYSRSTTTLAIPLHIKKALRSHSLLNVRDLETSGKAFGAKDLQNVIRLPLADCLLVINAINQKFDGSRIKNLHQLLAEEVRDNRFQKIPTSCPALDQLLNGGIRIGSLSEIYGEAGAGKTQLCLQLCINVQMPESLDGQQGEALFIDCEKSFDTKRLLEMAAAVAEQWYEGPAEHFLQKVHFQRCTSADMLRTAVMLHLGPYLDDHPQIRLVVLDGIPFLMRYGYESDLKERTQMLHLIAHQLRSLAQHKHVAVVITNQITYSLSEEKTLPALGKNWSGTCSTKISLSRAEDEEGNFVRTAALVKSQLTGHWREIPFQITSQGIC